MKPNKPGQARVNISPPLRTVRIEKGKRTHVFRYPTSQQLKFMLHLSDIVKKTDAEENSDMKITWPELAKLIKVLKNLEDKVREVKFKIR